VERECLGHAVDDSKGRARLSHEFGQVVEVYAGPERVLRADVVEPGGDVGRGGTQGQQTPDHASLVVLEVDVDHLVAGVELVADDREHEPGLAALGLTGDRVELAGVEQPDAV